MVMFSFHLPSASVGSREASETEPEASAVRGSSRAPKTRARVSVISRASARRRGVLRSLRMGATLPPRPRFRTAPLRGSSMREPEELLGGGLVAGLLRGVLVRGAGRAVQAVGDRVARGPVVD